jgi:hypothetical protein
MTQVTIHLKAWLNSKSTLGPQDLAEGKIGGLMYNNADMSPYGYTNVGNATITLDLLDQQTLVGNKIEALRNEAANVRAEAHAKVSMIESQIQNLLALPCNVTEAA